MEFLGFYTVISLRTQREVVYCKFLQKRLSKLPQRFDIVLTGIVLKDDVIIFHWPFHKSVRKGEKSNTCPSDLI